ncbi:response regulator [Seleniivibrio woodruffii]|uniref:Histidine kinase-like protein n=1 Tax=Seleniivibrio woodruffii TaxID=1078050 RepID=A0A4R1K6H2_9BACT|nr:response regulator [Seleniivibrio woodruffii]TCK59794.1 histidine kinase-like protein [Seleniivibrio woodruffii]TVZ35985.1 DNA-binding NtrC family response regulator [Seleniivibrio woodruffii]
MNEISIMTDLMRELTVLCVDDEPLALEYLGAKLARRFKSVLKASDGTEGLEMFIAQKPDLVITDNRMGFMDGIDMIKEIRRINADVPIILVTAYTEKDALVEAINNNVTQFLSKPIDTKKLTQAIEKSMQSFVNQRLHETNLRQELELLKYQEKYHSQQELNAFKKELSLIQNDLFLEKFGLKNCYGDEYSVYLNIFYKPLDILSGDIYSIRRLDDGSLFIFLADSMGKGLSASVTSILTSAYMNHIIDTEMSVVVGPLRNSVKIFNNYIRSILLDDEILSITFLKIDFAKEKMEIASFSSPPVYVKDRDGNVEIIKCNNPPLTKYMTDFCTDETDIRDVLGIMVITDGLYECRSHEGETMVDKVTDGFKASAMKTDFHKYVGSQMATPEDDISCIHILKIDEKLKDERVFEFESSLKNVGRSIEWAETCFTEMQSDFETMNMLTLAFTEMVMNSFEHSVLELDNRQKYQMINQGVYDDYIAAASSEKKIKTTIGIQHLWDKTAIVIRIEDEGTGFNPHILKTWMYDKEKSDGKGIKISRRITDEIYYAKGGRESIIIRVLEDHS